MPRLRRLLPAASVLLAGGMVWIWWKGAGGESGDKGTPVTRALRRAAGEKGPAGFPGPGKAAAARGIAEDGRTDGKPLTDEEFEFMRSEISVFPAPAEASPEFQRLAALLVARGPFSRQMQSLTEILAQRHSNPGPAGNFLLSALTARLKDPADAVVRRELVAKIQPRNMTEAYPYALLWFALAGEGCQPGAEFEALRAGIGFPLVRFALEQTHAAARAEAHPAEALAIMSGWIGAIKGDPSQADMISFALPSVVTKLPDTLDYRAAALEVNNNMERPVSPPATSTSPASGEAGGETALSGRIALEMRDLLLVRWMDIHAGDAGLWMSGPETFLEPASLPSLVDRLSQSDSFTAVQWIQAMTPGAHRDAATLAAVDHFVKMPAADLRVLAADIQDAALRFRALETLEIRASSGK